MKNYFLLPMILIRYQKPLDKHQYIYELSVETKENYQKAIETAKNTANCIPLFLRHSNNQLDIISSKNDALQKINKESVLVCLGEKLDAF